jgi:chitinase
MDLKTTKVKILLAAILSTALFPFLSKSCFAYNVVLQWNPVAGTDISGYRLYYRQDSQVQPFAGTGATQGSSPVDLHNLTTGALNGLDPAHGYYFAVTTYSSKGAESAYSNIVYLPELSPPTVSLSYPAANTTVSGTVSVAASASDNVGVAKVEFYLNGVLQSTDSSPPYLYSWNTVSTPPGSYTLSAKAYDAAGNVGQSDAVPVNVINDVTPPVVAVTQPANNATVGGTVTVNASASDNTAVTRVEFYQNQALLCAGNLPPYSCSWNTAEIGNGSYTLSAKAYDASGNLGQSSITVLVNNAGLVCSNPPVWVAGASYANFALGYARAPDNAVVALQTLDLAGDLLLNRDVRVMVQGGYDCSFAASSASTGILGNLRVANGTALVDKLYFK